MLVIGGFALDAFHLQVRVDCHLLLRKIGSITDEAECWFGHCCAALLQENWRVSSEARNALAEAVFAHRPGEVRDAGSSSSATVPAASSWSYSQTTRCAAKVSCGIVRRRTGSTSVLSARFFSVVPIRPLLPRTIEKALPIGID
jgi:hypothetical protein